MTDSQILLADVQTLSRLLESALNLAAVAGVEIDLAVTKTVTHGMSRHELIVKVLNS